MLTDLRHAFRSLSRSPGFALVATVTLALGIGATSAMFTVTNLLVLQPCRSPSPNGWFFSGAASRRRDSRNCLPHSPISRTCAPSPRHPRHPRSRACIRPARDAGLTIRSFVRLKQVNPGFTSAGVLSADLTISRTEYADPVKVAGFYSAALERIASLPGVTGAGAVEYLPM